MFALSSAFLLSLLTVFTREILAFFHLPEAHEELFNLELANFVIETSDIDLKSLSFIHTLLVLIG
jgi:hypothetical protein